MYQRTLNIYLSTNDPALEHLVNSIDSLDRFSHNIICQKPGFTDNLQSAAIIILDSPDSYQYVQQFFKTKAANTKLIVCLTEESLNLLKDSYDFVDEFWYRPLDPEKILVSFTRVLSAIKAQEDAALTTTYLDTLIDTLPDLIWFKDARGAHLKINNSFCKTVNKTKNQIEGRGHFFIWDIEPDEYAQGEFICLESEEIVFKKKRGLPV